MRFPEVAGLGVVEDYFPGFLLSTMSVSVISFLKAKASPVGMYHLQAINTAGGDNAAGVLAW